MLRAITVIMALCVHPLGAWLGVGGLAARRAESQPACCCCVDQTTDDACCPVKTPPPTRDCPARCGNAALPTPALTTVRPALARRASTQLSAYTPSATRRAGDVHARRCAPSDAPGVLTAHERRARLCIWTI